MTSYQLAQINIGRMAGQDINDPIMKEFVDNLDAINQLAEQSEGFIWRLKDESNNASSFNPYHDDRVIINMSVWKDLPSLEAFTFKSLHTDFLKRRKEWFTAFGKPYIAMWWIQAGEIPSIEAAVERLDYLQNHGPSEYAFNFRKKFPAPTS